VLRNYSGNGPPPYKRGSFFPSVNRLTVYTITDVQSAPYKTILPFLEKWRNILRQRPKSEPEYGLGFPDYLMTDCAHLVEARVEYANYSWGEGCFYITQYCQGPDSLANDTLYFNFEGMSKDCKYWVSGQFNIMHPKLPDRHGPEPAHRIDKSTEADALLRGFEDDSFTPSLRKIKAWVGSLKID